MLAVPKFINLSKIESIKDLDIDMQAILKSTIMFEFGSQHKKNRCMV